MESGKVVLNDGGKLKVRISMSNGKAYDREGVVDFTSRTVDTATGTVLARAEFPNPTTACCRASSSARRSRASR